MSNKVQRDAYVSRMRIKYFGVRDLLIVRLGGRCHRCGRVGVSKKNLLLVHVDAVKQEEISGTNFYTRLNILKREVAAGQVKLVCRNCVLKGYPHERRDEIVAGADQYVSSSMSYEASLKPEEPPLSESEKKDRAALAIARHRDKIKIRRAELVEKLGSKCKFCPKTVNLVPIHVDREKQKEIKEASRCRSLNRLWAQVRHGDTVLACRSCLKKGVAYADAGGPAVPDSGPDRRENSEGG